MRMQRPSGAAVDKQTLEVRAVLVTETVNRGRVKTWIWE